MGKFNFHDFNILENSDDLVEYLKGREYGHTDYCHYSSLSTIDAILGNSTFRLSNVNGFNDTVDSDQFEEKWKYYSLCFSTGVNENLPLWYLYSGIEGCGGRIRINKGKIKLLLSNAKYTLCGFDEDNTSFVIKELKEGKNIKITFGDVLYYLEKGGKLSLKYNTKTNYNIPIADFEDYKKSHIGFLKSLIWYYEKETRIVAELMGDALNEIESCDKPEEKYFIQMSIDKRVMDSMKIDLAPGIVDENMESMLQGQNNIKKYIFDSSKVKLSDYKGTVRMKIKEGLCKTCIHKGNAKISKSE